MPNKNVDVITSKVQTLGSCKIYIKVYNNKRLNEVKYLVKYL